MVVKNVVKQIPIKDISMILEENNDKTDLNIIKANKNHIIQNMKAP